MVSFVMIFQDFLLKEYTAVWYAMDKLSRVNYWIITVSFA